MRRQTNYLHAVLIAVTSVACVSESGDATQWREVFDFLPSGVVISVEISDPDDGDLMPQGPLAVNGFATIGETEPVAQSTLAYIVDVSGSTLATNGCGGDLNSDGISNSVLDCEIAALMAVNGMATAMGTVADVGAAVFGTQGATADVRPAGGQQLLTGTDADFDGNGQDDIDQVLRSMVIGGVGEFTAHSVGQATSYGAGLDAIEPVLSASSQPEKIVVMVSDGFNNTGPNVNVVLPTLPAGTIIHAFAIGSSADCDDDTPLGSLRDVAEFTGGSCTNVPKVADLPDVIPSVIAVELIGLELRVDAVPEPIDVVAPPLPQDGPKTINYSTTVEGLAPGIHTLCATATGVDAIGNEDVTECVKVKINSPPVAVCQDVIVAADDACMADADVDGGSFDKDLQDIECEADPEGPYTVGITEVVLTCTDPFGAKDSCKAIIEVVDETPPKLDTVDVLAELWPPNHKYHGFSIEDCVESSSDNCDGDLDLGEALEIINVRSDEAELANGSGNTCDDIVILGPTTFEVRAERRGGGDGRVYTVQFAATDTAWNSTTGTCEVLVPKSQNSGASDSGCELCVGDDCKGCSSGDPECD
jgi:hypothetical protein